jgi:GxxExxY protein|uniref:GxxExxY protein n=1 Tax=Cephaloticoccus sp. TaxID=1985742 RepID=UPI00404AD705
MKQVLISAETERLATQTVDAAYAVHRTFGPGLLERAYQDCMVIELGLRGLQLEREKILPLNYRGQTVENAYRLDLLINGTLLVELKTVESIQPIHRVQTTTYLKLLKLPLGLLINFNVPLIKDGITRVLNLDFQS